MFLLSKILSKFTPKRNKLHLTYRGAKLGKIQGGGGGVGEVTQDLGLFLKGSTF